jgi:hypothetical protein
VRIQLSPRRQSLRGQFAGLGLTAALEAVHRAGRGR